MMRIRNRFVMGKYYEPILEQVEARYYPFYTFQDDNGRPNCTRYRSNTNPRMIADVYNHSIEFLLVETKRKPAPAELQPSMAEAA